MCSSSNLLLKYIFLVYKLLSSHFKDFELTLCDYNIDFFFLFVFRSIIYIIKINGDEIELVERGHGIKTRS